MLCIIFMSFIVIPVLADCRVTSPPRIVKQPTQEEILFQVAKPGERDNLIIECEAEGEPAPKYRWIKDGEPFDYTSANNRISQQSGRGTLVVSAPRAEDRGQYQCFASNEWGTATSNSVFVRRAELITQSYSLYHYEHVFLQHCISPDGGPNLNVEWSSSADTLKSINNSRMTVDAEGNLWLSNATRNDASVEYAYICKVDSYGYRYEGIRVYLKMTIARNFTEQKVRLIFGRIQNALKGKKVELYCSSMLIGQIVWKKNGRSIPSSQRITQEYVGKILVIKYATYEDQGTYTCEVGNEVDPSEVLNIQLIVEAAPFFTIEPEFQILAEGETATITCVAEGIPAPSISWIHNGKPIEQAEPNSRRQVTENSIIISNLVKKDTGNYGCNATNHNGYVYKDVYINVINESLNSRTLGKNNETNLENNTEGSLRTLVGYFIISAIMLLVVVACLVVVCYNKPCRTQPQPTPQPVDQVDRNPFYLNMLFRKQCQREIDDIEGHHYEEIDDIVEPVYEEI